MPGRSMTHQGLLLQREVTPGTPLTNAMKRVLGIRLTPGHQDEGEPFTSSGSKMPTAYVPTTEMGEHDVESIQDFNAMTWTLCGGFGAPVSTGVAAAVGDATEHVYALNPYAADTVAAFTAIWGDGTQAIQASNLVFNSLGLSIARGQLSLDSSAISKEPTYGAAIPGSGVTDVASTPIPARTWDVWADDTWATLGTTKLLAAYRGDIDFGDKYGPDWVINSANPSFDSLMEAEDTDRTANLVLGFDAVAVALVTTFKNGAFKFIRFASTGPVIDETGVPANINAEVEIDLCLKITSRGKIETAPDSPSVALPFECLLMPDPTSGNAAAARLVNTVVSL